MQSGKVALGAGSDCVRSRSFSQVKLFEIPWNDACFGEVLQLAATFFALCSTPNAFQHYGEEPNLATVK
jgi:hypothetical protein